jgi:heme/copper-type cytochrome/quinol oxidase subunit 2
MNTSALITMLATWIVVIGFTSYFFIKVLKGNNDQNQIDNGN